MLGEEGSMTTPRTVAGQAALSGMRPWVKRALANTILAIETEAVAPYVEALREADRVLGSLAIRDASATWETAARVDLVRQAEAAHRLAGPLLAPLVQAERG
jgi:hypothetical protein